MTILLFCFLFFNSSFSQINFQEKSLDEIETDKPIFVYVDDLKCKPCKNMERTTFRDQVVIDIINKKFTCLKWNAKDNRFKDLVKQFDVSSFPTILFLNDELEQINKPVGFLRSKDFEKISRECSLPHKSDSLKIE